MRKLRLFVLYPLLAIVIIVAGALSYVSFALPDVGPAPDIKVEITPERVERGRYLVENVALCTDCHAHRDMTKFAGPRVAGTEGAGGEVFDTEVGYFTAKNITPAKLGDWTDGEIYRAITAGVNKDGDALFPIMPWANYAQLSDEDIYAMIAYIRTLPPVEGEMEPSTTKFPMNFIINLMPTVSERGARPDTADKIAYGKYVITMASCGDCHTPMEQGKPVAGMQYAGGMEFKLPSGDVVRSANITPDKETGIGNLSREEFIAKFKKYADSTYTPHAVDPGSFNTIMPWIQYAGMKESDLGAIYDYLMSLEPVNHLPERFTPAAAMASK